MKATTLFAKASTLLFGGLALCALTLGSLWLAPTTPALAAAGTPPAKPTPSYAGLKAAYAAEQGWLSLQTGHLNAANTVVASVIAYIDAQKALGVDTAAMSAALSAYQAAIAKAQASHDSASSTLTARAGFDGSGNVTDPTQAKATVTSVHQSLNDAHATLVQADKDLHAALTQFRALVEQARLGRERNWLNLQQQRLDDANTVAGQVQTYINNQNAKGQDTSALAAALATYQQQVAAATTAHTAAANLLASPAGFDGSGNVTDITQAHQTLANAYSSLISAHNTLAQAGQAMRSALQSYRQAHK